MFPLRGGGKLPLIASAHPDGDPARGVCHGECGQQGHGLYDATLDLERIAAWWTRWPRANVGARTGVTFDVLDLDGPEGAEAMRQFCAEHGVSLERVPWVRTPGGGWHGFFAPSGLGCTVGMLAKVDWRGQGGYVVVGPSVHPNGGAYREVPAMADRPPWIPGPLRALLERAMAPPPGPARQAATFRPGSTSTAYARAVLGNAMARLLEAASGARNATLFREGASLFGLVAGGVVNEAEAVALLEDAGRAVGLPPREASSTIASARRRGMQKPRGVPADPPLPPPVRRPGDVLSEDAWAARDQTTREAKPQVVPCHHETRTASAADAKPQVESRGHAGNPAVFPIVRLRDLYRTLEFGSFIDGNGRRVREGITLRALARHHGVTERTVKRDLGWLERLGALTRERRRAAGGKGGFVNESNRYVLRLDPAAVRLATVTTDSHLSENRGDMALSKSAGGIEGTVMSLSPQNHVTPVTNKWSFSAVGSLQPVGGGASPLDEDLREALGALRAGFGEVEVAGVYRNDDPRLAAPDVRIGAGTVEVAADAYEPMATEHEPLPVVPSHRRSGRGGAVDLAACSADELHRALGQLDMDTCSNGDRCALGRRCRRHTRRVRAER